MDSKEEVSEGEDKKTAEGCREEGSQEQHGPSLGVKRGETEGDEDDGGGYKGGYYDPGNERVLNI